ncbi:MAG: lysophospholipase [Candidatus Dormibacteraeota bacterium]|nr:lysophospholipase [Candidatus Dormibacteraeota bacterium]
MTVLESTLSSPAGADIHVRSWTADTEPTAVIVIAHGFAEHGGRYAALAQRLNAQGWSVVAADHRGHGRSSGKRRSIRSFGEYVADLHAVIEQSRRDEVPVVLLGHSMGGLVALVYALGHESLLHALVLSAPAACPGRVSRVTLLSGRVVSRIAPDAGVLRLPLQRISRDPAVVDQYMRDPLVSVGPMRARLGAEMLDAMARVDHELPRLRLPLLAMQGVEDGLVVPGCARHVYELAGSPDKTLREYPGLWHEIFNEPERDVVINDLISWLRWHVATAGG